MHRRESSPRHNPVAAPSDLWAGNSSSNFTPSLYTGRMMISTNPVVLQRFSRHEIPCGSGGLGTFFQNLARSKLAPKGRQAGSRQRPPPVEPIRAPIGRTRP